MLIVSLTSYPARISTVHEAIESVHNGDYPIDKFILNLSSDEFQGIDLPSNLINLDYLTINWVRRNTYTFKKVLPIVDDHPDDLILCMDDDILYPPNFASSYVSTFNRYGGKYTISMNFHPASVCPFGRGTLFKPGSLLDYHYYINDDIIRYRNDDKFLDVYFRSRSELVVPVLGFDQRNLNYMDYESGWQFLEDDKMRSSQKMDSLLNEFTLRTQMLVKYRNNIQHPVMMPEMDLSYKTLTMNYFRYWNNW